MEGAIIHKSILKGELPDQEWISIWMLYESKILCHNIAFWILLEQFIYPDQIAETEQV